MTHRMILVAAAAMTALLSACELAYFVREPRRRVHEPPPVHDPTPPPPAADDEDPYMERGERGAPKAPAESLQPVFERDTRVYYVPSCNCAYCYRARPSWSYPSWSYGVSWSRRGWGWGIGWGW